MRLFFASWPSAGVAESLARWAREAQRECGGRATREESIHLTLRFLGDADPEAARAMARGVHVPAMSFNIEQARYRAHNRIVWVGPQECPAPLAALTRQLGEQRDFAAHVTLVRKARAPQRLPAPPALEWPVKDFVLVNSNLGPEGPGYEVLERYALQ